MSKAPVPGSIRACLAITALLVTTSCGDSARSITAPQADAPAGPLLATQVTGPDGNTLKVTAGNNQTWYAGERLPQLIRVELKDNTGAPLVGRAVSWAVGGGGGYTYRSTALTDASGRLDVYWTLGSAAGAKTLDATVSGTGTVRVDARAIPRGSRMHLVMGDSQSARYSTALPVQPTIALRDSLGNPLAGVQVKYRILSGGGTLASAAKNTGGNGQAANGWTLGSGTGIQQMRAYLPGVDSITFTAQSFNSITLSLVSGSGQAGLAGDTLTNRVRVRALTYPDGLPVWGATLMWTSSLGSKFQVARTDLDGYVGARVQLSVNAGPDTVTASLAGASARATATVRTRRFAQVSLENYSGCGITAQKYLYCWGNEQWGLLGNGRTAYTGTSFPQRVTSPATWKMVSVGQAHACGITTADDAYCWGRGQYGQIGNGQLLENNPRPVAVSGGRKWKWISAGVNGTCGVTTANQGFCWGNNQTGQLGSNPGACYGAVPCSAVPVAVDGGLSFQAIDYNDAAACGLTTDGAAYCWGSDHLGLLGDGPASASNCSGLSGVCYPRQVTGGHTFKQISVGPGYACALRTDGVAYCWGGGGTGQLASSTSCATGYICSFDPIVIGGGHTFKDLEAGSMSVCGLTTAGAAYCWGANSSRQLGIATASSNCSGYPCEFAPVAVSGGRVFTDLAVGVYTVMGVAGDGIYGWGYNGTNLLLMAPGYPSDTYLPRRAHWVQ